MLLPLGSSGGLADLLRLDAVYVLTVRSLHQRIAHVSRELARQGVHFEFILDYDPSDLNAEAIDGVFGPSELLISHQSLVLKHMRAWQLACERNHRRILVFEDDVLLAHDFLSSLVPALLSADAKAPGWLIFLGGADTKVSDDFLLRQEPLIPMSIATAEAYVTDLAACQARLGWCRLNRITLPADHLIRHIDQVCGIRQYWLPEAIVEQGSVTGRFASTLDRHRMKHSWLFNWARYRWNKLRRRRLRGWWVRFSRSAPAVGGDAEARRAVER